ncbi:MAG: hypothetical protein AAGC66_00045 [Leifsonia sp.]
MDRLSEHREELSKSFFGSAYMLVIVNEIVHCADAEGRFTAPDVIEATRLPASTVHSVLNRLKRGRVVRRTGISTPERLAIYERRPSRVWDFAQELEEEAREVENGYLDELWQRHRIA